MKYFFRTVVFLPALIMVLAACTSPQLTENSASAGEPAAVSESESEVEVITAPLEVVEERAEEVADVVEIVPEVAVGPTAAEVAAIEKAAAGAIKAEERAPTFRNNNEQEAAADAAPDDVKSLADYLPVLGAAPEIINGEPWINSDPLSLEQLKGKVVLVEFWTYT